MSKRLVKLGALILLLACATTICAEEDFASDSKRIPMRFTPRLDAQIPLDLKFIDDEGLPIELGKLYQQKPVILNLVYFNCPMMCTEVLNGLVAAMRKMPLQLGMDYNVI